MIHIKQTPWIIIITGPTASGKTALSELIAEEVDGEIINVDVGQFYKNLSVGTAKPNWKTLPFSCHMFDILDQPIDVSVREYRDRVLQLCKDITERNRTPIIVGGSLFYIKSLFSPPKDLAKNIDSGDDFSNVDFEESSQILWSRLNEIDPKRAELIHPNDRYRIVRALTIWKTTGKKPSFYKPGFLPLPYNVLIVPLLPDRELINDRINQRTTQMVTQGGWIQEALSVYKTEWHPFILRKGLIGYLEIFQWIENGSRIEDLHNVVKIIQQKTRDYAKRQVTFWRGLERYLIQHVHTCQQHLIINPVREVSFESFKKTTQFVKKLIKFK